MHKFTYGSHEATKNYKGKNTFNSPKIFPLQPVQSPDVMTADVPRSLIWICVIE